MPENLPSLYYLVDDKLEILPGWAYFYLQLGYQLAAIPNKSERIVLGLAIPTRVFASCLVATGVVLANRNTTNSIDEAQFQFVRNLELNTPVYIRTDNNKRLRGIFSGFVNSQGKEYLSIRTSEMTVRYYLFKDYVSRITVSEKDVSLPKHQQNGYVVEAPSKFLQSCLGQEFSRKHVLDSTCEALLVGKKSVLQSEAMTPLFYCKTSSKSNGIAGCLQEILRVRQFLRADQAYRTQCISSVNAAPEKEVSYQDPPVVIFDGAVAYLKCSHQWPCAHQVVLLDKTEPQFADAVELLNQNYAYRSAEDPVFSIRIPAGIEMMIYKETI